MDSTHIGHIDTCTQSLESLLGVLHSKNCANTHAAGASAQTDHDAVLQKLDSIVVGVCASLDILHAKVDSLCAGMQLIRTELEVPDLQPTMNMPPRADDTAKPDFVAINVREDTPEEASAACTTTPLPVVDSAATATDPTLTTLTTLAVPFPHEPDSKYTNSTDILNVLWPGLPKNDHDELDINRIRQEAELVHEVD
jgi:hypothetical protein